jgi:hypothetical protein
LCILVLVVVVNPDFTSTPTLYIRQSYGLYFHYFTRQEQNGGCVLF